MEKSILLKINNLVAYVKLNRPKVFNSFNREMAISLQEILDELARNQEVRCVVLIGEGKAFCAGQDLSEATIDEKFQLRKAVREHYNPIIEKIRNIKKPVVAAVNGIAAGAGANLALACDVVVAKKTACFIQAFSKIGLIPDSGGTYFLPRLIGMQKASAFMLLADKISAYEANKLGMIYTYYEDDSFEDSVNELATKLSKLPTIGLWLTKKALNETYSNNLIQQLKLEENLQAEAGQTEDFEEGVSAFLEKRNPVFKGK